MNKIYLFKYIYIFKNIFIIEKIKKWTINVNPGCRMGVKNSWKRGKCVKSVMGKGIIIGRKKKCWKYKKNWQKGKRWKNLKNARILERKITWKNSW